MFNLRSVLLVASSLVCVKAITGEVTWYEPGVGLGACGILHSANDYIAAMAHDNFDSYPGATSNPNNNPICRQNIRLTYGGRSVVVSVQDRCAGCAANNVDLAPIAFRVLADQSVGRLFGVQWDYTSSPVGPA